MITPDPQSAHVTRLAADIRALASIERPSASPGEEEAAQWVKSRFEETGLTAEIETFRYNPDYWTAWGAHGVLTALAAGAALLSHRTARAAAVGSALTAMSLFGEFTSSYHLLRRLLPTRSSYNVVARLKNPSASRVLIVSAHHDAPRSGLMFHPVLTSTMARLFGPSRDQSVPFGATLGGMLAVSVGAFSVSVGTARRLASRLLWLGGLGGVAFATLMWDVGRRPMSPGANDDASGVAVVLGLASALRREPLPDAEVWFLSTGSEEGILGGMRAFLTRHREELAEREPVVLNLEMLGSGRVAFLEGEGFLWRRGYLGPAPEVAREVAAEGAFRGVRALATAPFVTDAQVATQFGIPAVTVVSISEDGQIPHYHWPTDTADNVHLGSVQDAFAFAHRLAVRLAAVRM